MRLFNCAVPAHKEYQMNLLCTKQNCARFLQACCIQCQEKSSQHAHKGSFENLKKILQGLCEKLEKSQQVLRVDPDRENLPPPVELNQQWFEDTARQLQEIAASCQKIVQAVQSAYKQYRLELEGQQRHKRADQQRLLEIARVFDAFEKSKNSQEFSQALLELKKYVQEENGTLTLKTGGFLHDPQTLRQIQIYQTEVEKAVQNLQKMCHTTLEISSRDVSPAQLTQNTSFSSSSTASLSQSYLVQTGSNNVNKPTEDVQWIFQKQITNIENSQTLSILEAQIFNVEQLPSAPLAVYSSEAFSHGRHGFQLKIIKKGKDSFCVGIVEDGAQENTFAQDNVYRSLDAAGQGNLVTQKYDENLWEKIKEGEVIQVQLNLDKSTFRIANAEGKVYYSLQSGVNLLEKYKKIRFCVFAVWDTLKLKLVDSY